MDDIQKVLVKAGRKDLAQAYYKKITAGRISDSEIQMLLKRHDLANLIGSLGDYLDANGYNPPDFSGSGKYDQAVSKLAGELIDWSTALAQAENM